MTRTMRFRCPGDTPLHLALTTGHTLVIPPEGCEVPDIFRREAIANGAEPMSDTGEALAPSMTQEPAALVDRKALIEQAVQKMLDGGDEGDFTNQGVPNLNRVKVLAGFNVSRTELDEVWATVSKEAGSKEAGATA